MDGLADLDVHSHHVSTTVHRTTIAATETTLVGLAMPSYLDYAGACRCAGRHRSEVCARLGVGGAHRSSVPSTMRIGRRDLQTLDGHTSTSLRCIAIGRLALLQNVRDTTSQFRMRTDSCLPGLRSASVYLVHGMSLCRAATQVSEQQSNCYTSIRMASDTIVFLRCIFSRRAVVLDQRGAMVGVLEAVHVHVRYVRSNNGAVVLQLCTFLSRPQANKISRSGRHLRFSGCWA